MGPKTSVPGVLRNSHADTIRHLACFPATRRRIHRRWPAARMLPGRRKPRATSPCAPADPTRKGAGSMRKALLWTGVALGALTALGYVNRDLLAFDHLVPRVHVRQPGHRLRLRLRNDRRAGRVRLAGTDQLAQERHGTHRR
jgi:hypothetical protein